MIQTHQTLYLTQQPLRVASLGFHCHCQLCQVPMRKVRTWSQFDAIVEYNRLQSFFPSFHTLIIDLISVSAAMTIFNRLDLFYSKDIDRTCSIYLIK